MKELQRANKKIVLEQRGHYIIDHKGKDQKVQLYPEELADYNEKKLDEHMKVEAINKIERKNRRKNKVEIKRTYEEDLEHKQALLEAGFEDEEQYDPFETQ